MDEIEKDQNEHWRNLPGLNIQEKEELLNFAKRIVPKRWNVFVDHRDYILRQGTLNIFLDIRDPAEWRNVESDGMVHAGISYRDGIGHCHLIIQAWKNKKHTRPKFWKSVLVHELTHVSVYRFYSFHLKTYLGLIDSYDDGKVRMGDLQNYEMPDYPAIHGKTFKLFHTKMKARAKRFG